ncbi:MAG: MBL fold metallo-hydrolase [Alphaproteobacteria bacterium]|nr:MBL fold metallo-hydrolase [Alphaproteobacteria bacterium]
MGRDGKLHDGLSAWRCKTNHNRMIDFQAAGEIGPGGDGGGAVQLEYFGGSAFRITSPAGLTIMIDPWRNLPTGAWDWYFHDFPTTAVDIGVSTHAHFDHDALHLLDAHVLLDRLIGRYEFSDVVITGIADKHAIDASHAVYDMHLINTTFGGQKLDPPDNVRSFDNCLIIVETGGLRILHWGDNRHNPPDDVWQRVGAIDIALLPVDDSRHVMGFPMVEEVIARLSPKVVVPHHYYIWNVVQRQSTLLTPEKWLAEQAHVRRLEDSKTTYTAASLLTETTVDYFGGHVAFDIDKWHADNGLILKS